MGEPAGEALAVWRPGAYRTRLDICLVRNRPDDAYWWVYLPNIPCCGSPEDLAHCELHYVHRARIVAVVGQDHAPREVREGFPTVLVDREAFEVDGYGLRRALEWCAPEENDVTGFIAAHCTHPLFPPFMCGPGAVALRVMSRRTVDEHFRRYARNKQAPPLRAGETWEYAGRRTYAVQHSEVEDDGVRHTCVVLANASHPEQVGREVYLMEGFDQQRWEDDERYRQVGE